MEDDESNLGEENIPKFAEYFSKTLQDFLELEPTAKRLRPYVQYRIEKMFALGYGTEQDYTKVFEYYKLSADQNNAYACYEAAKMLRDGISVEKTLSKWKYISKRLMVDFLKLLPIVPTIKSYIGSV